MAQSLGTTVIQAAEAKKSPVVDYCFSETAISPQVNMRP